MGEVKQEISPKSKSHLPQQDGLQETELLPQPGIPSTLGNQIISRIGNTPSQKAHADMLNRAPASNKQLLLQLQRQYGNSYVQQVVQQARQQDRPKIQAKLTIGEPGDKYEQEADRVAQQVVQQINAPVAPSAQSEAVQRQMPGEKDEDELQMKPIVQRQAEAGMDAAPDVEASINQARGGGVAIADNIREPMEVAFGADFSGVKVHTDGQSDQLNRSIHARAFTTGQDVFFRQGEYNPGSRGGQELIAHELTHVVQQSGGAVQRSLLPLQELPQHPTTETPSASASDRPIQAKNDHVRLEHEAEVMGARAVVGGLLPSPIHLFSTPGGLQGVVQRVTVQDNNKYEMEDISGKTLYRGSSSLVPNTAFGIGVNKSGNAYASIMVHLLNNGQNSKWVSTTSDRTQAEEYAGESGWVYMFHGISQPGLNANNAYEKHKDNKDEKQDLNEVGKSKVPKTYPFAHQMETSVWNLVNGTEIVGVGAYSNKNWHYYTRHQIENKLHLPQDVSDRL